MSTALQKKTPRIEAVDALRGFAVMAILLIHSVEHFIFPVYPPAQAGWLDVLNQGVFSVTFSLFAGKAYAIFALLFGFTFYIQYTNQKLKGKDFGPRFLWRLLLLLGFATLNAAFFPAGDVLLLFAVVGTMLVITRKWSDKAVLVLAVILLLQPVEWFHYVVAQFDPSYTLPDLGVGPMYETVAEYTKAGDFRDFIWGNVTLGQKASLLWAVGAGRFLQTAGLFLLGMLLGRRQLFVATEQSCRFWVKALIAGAVSFGVLYPLYVLASGEGSAEMARRTVGVILDMWQKLAFTAVLVASFVLLYRKESFQRRTTALRFYGRMSLTNYVSQSIIGALIYFPFGLYLAPYCGYALSLLIGFGVLVLQVLFCRWWLSRHKQGPLEALWHKLTWLGTGK